MTLIESERERPGQAPPERLLRDDPKKAAGKIAIFQYLTIGVFVFLVAGFWRLQVQNPDVYSEAAERNRIKSTPVLAARGKILDRDGRVIVDNKASYSLLLNRDEIQPEHLRPIAQALQIDYDELAKKIRRMSSLPQIIIKDQLSRDEMAWVESHQDANTYPEMQVVRAWHGNIPRTVLPRM